MRFAPVQIVTNQSMTTSFNSIGIDCNQHALASIQAEWTGATATGTLKLQISDDIVPVQPTTGNPVGANPAGEVVNWSDYTGSTTTVSGPGNFMWNMVYVGFRWVRLVYTSSSGTGTLNATFAGKG
jgi:hypothetical protein